MSYSRREFGKLALAGLPAAALLETPLFGSALVQAKPNSKFSGVQIGVITYSYRSMPDQSGEATLKYVLGSGISGIELMDTPAEISAGRPNPPENPARGAAGGRGGTRRWSRRRSSGGNRGGSRRASCRSPARRAGPCRAGRPRCRTAPPTAHRRGRSTRRRLRGASPDGTPEIQNHTTADLISPIPAPAQVRHTPPDPGKQAVR